jgi:hypothetical protein
MGAFRKSGTDYPKNTPEEPRSDNCVGAAGDAGQEMQDKEMQDRCRTDAGQMQDRRNYTTSSRTDAGQMQTDAGQTKLHHVIKYCQEIQTTGARGYFVRISQRVAHRQGTFRPLVSLSTGFPM